MRCICSIIYHIHYNFINQFQLIDLMSKFESNIWKFGLYNFIDNIRLIWMISTLYYLWLGFTYTNISIHEVFFAATIFLFEVPLGALADYIGKRKTILISCFFHGLSYLFLGLMNFSWQFYLIAILIGLGF